MEITFLGTSSMVPTKDRNVQGIYLEYNGEGILFDCGEGTQRQMNIAGINRHKVKKIFISHWHGDHVSGLIGLVQTINSVSDENNPKKLEIYGPTGTKERFGYMLKTVYFDNRLIIKVHDINAPKLKTVFTNDNYSIKAINVDHGIPAVGYRFEEHDRRRISVSKIKKLAIPDGPLLGKLQKGDSITWKGKKYNSDDLTYIVSGKKCAFILDTAYTKNTIELAQNADIVLCEATYVESELEKGEKHNHLTALQAAQIASSANAKKLIMTHFSQRYTDVSVFEEEARKVFPESYAGFDFMKVKLL